MGNLITKYKEETTIYKILFISILVTFSSIATTYSFFTPTFEGPDEFVHYKYARMALEGELRLFDNTPNPLYYMALAGFLNFIDHPDDVEIKISKFFKPDKNRYMHYSEELFPFSGTASAVHILRAFSILCGLITLIFTFKIAQLVVPGDRWFPLCTMAFVSLIPVFLFINSVLNPDVLIWSLSTISLFLLFKFVKNPSNTKYLILMSVFVGLSVFTKTNGVMLYPVIFVAFGYLLYSKQTHLKLFLKNLGIFGSISIASGTWFEIYRTINFGFYGVFETTSAILMGGSGNSLGGATLLFENLNRFTHIPDLKRRIFEMIWQKLGWNIINAENSSFFLPVASTLMIIGIAGLILLILKRDPFSKIRLDKNHFVILFSAAGFFMLVIFLFYFLKGGGVIRNALPAISVFGILFTLGVYVYLNKKKLRPLIIIALIFLVLLNFALLEHMNKWYEHAFKSFNSPFEMLRFFHDIRPDIKRVFTEVEEKNDYTRLIFWAEKNGVYGNQLLAKNKPMIELLGVYYRSDYLTEKFPEVRTDHNVKNLIEWTTKNPEKIPVLINRVEVFRFEEYDVNIFEPDGTTRFSGKTRGSDVILFFERGFTIEFSTEKLPLGVIPKPDPETLPVLINGVEVFRFEEYDVNIFEPDGTVRVSGKTRGSDVILFFERGFTIEFSTEKLPLEIIPEPVPVIINGIGVFRFEEYDVNIFRPDGAVRVSGKTIGSDVILFFERGFTIEFSTEKLPLGVIHH